ncbi:MAG: mismatch endonuclease, patch repair protein [Candidatus Sumerlaeota bacterium]|nr:mismatch endonuclease, patch repair protein [Candidatus Sumerlaeota bacterium]
MDSLSRRERSENMRRIRSKDMAPELAVRRLVHAAGYRYRLHRKDLPGKPDLVFPARGKVIFVHGCFWHQHSARKCGIVRKPKSNTGYWEMKLANNVRRDRRNRRALKRLGWDVLIVWECQTRDPAKLEARIRRFLG